MFSVIALTGQAGSAKNIVNTISEACTLLVTTTKLKNTAKMKKCVLVLGLLSSSILLNGQSIISTAGSGAGAFRTQVNDYSTSPSFVTGSATFGDGTVGWANSGGDWAFMQMLQFDMAGFESSLNSGNDITLTLDSFQNLKGGTEYSVWFATLSNVDIRSQGNGGGNGILGADPLRDMASMPITGTKVGTITSIGSFDFDVTSILSSLDYSTDKHVYFRVQVDLPGTNPGVGSLGTAILADSVITVVPEPSTYAGILGGVSLLWIAARRRRKAV